MELRIGINMDKKCFQYPNQAVPKLHLIRCLGTYYVIIFQWTFVYYISQPVDLSFQVVNECEPKFSNAMQNFNKRNLQMKRSNDHVIANIEASHK